MYRADAGLVFFIIIWVLIISIGLISKVVKALKAASVQADNEGGNAADYQQDELWQPQASPTVQRSTPPPVPTETQPGKQETSRRTVGEGALAHRQSQQTLQRQQERLKQPESAPTVGEGARVHKESQETLRRQKELLTQAEDGQAPAEPPGEPGSVSPDVWGKRKPRTRVKINLRNVKDVRHAVIVREILDRPRAFDI